MQKKMANGFKDIAVACLMIGIARGILVILQAGHIIDTVVYGLSIPLTNLPGWISSIAMLIVQTLINFLIPSGSGQAVTSMPIMAPLADLVGDLPAKRYPGFPSSETASPTYCGPLPLRRSSAVLQGSRLRNGGNGLFLCSS